MGLNVVVVRRGELGEVRRRGCKRGGIEVRVQEGIEAIERG